MARTRNSNFSRIELGFGGGDIDCLLDLASGRIERYAGDPRDFPRYGEEPCADGIHSRLGGKQFYQSRSGCSGAGWIPAKPTLKKVGTYRVDVGGVLLGFSPEREFAPHVGEFEVYAPYSYRGGDTGEHPVVVRERDGKVTLVPEWQLAPFLRGEIEIEPRTFEFTYLKDVHSGERKLVATVHQPKDRYDRGDGRALRLLVEGFHHAELAFVFPEGWQPEGDGEFWKRLGFRRLPDGLYKVVRNIARYKLGGWDDLERIKKSVPANVHMLAPNLYIQERDQRYVGVARFQYEGRWYDFESYIDTQEALRIFAGNSAVIAKLEQELERGAHTKHVRALEDAKRMEDAARETLARDQVFRELLEQNADVEISVADSLAAGNCRPGTDDFVQRFFPGRATVTVRELARFAANWNVRRVLEHKLITAPQQAAHADDSALLRPLQLDAPLGEPDDLKRIVGVTPRNEQSLNDLGLYHFWQIAGLTPEQSAALDRELRLRGAIERDGWVAAAKSLVGDRQ